MAEINSESCFLLLVGGGFGFFGLEEDFFFFFFFFLSPLFEEVFSLSALAAFS